MFKYVVIAGGISCGYTIYGPFDSAEQALAWAERHIKAAWEIVKCEDPEKEFLPKKAVSY